MEHAPSVVSQSLTLELIDASGAASPLEAELGYDASDPFAVVAVFRADDIRIRWVLGRDLLAEGIFAPAGDGDVHVWPCLDARGRAVVILELSSPHGEALLQAASSDVNDFLQRTFELVPRGAEDVALDLDEALFRLLDDGTTPL
ncbi:MAG: SsgA family sporulation/cell division regulator [Nocardioidaceae bacterium]